MTLYAKTQIQFISASLFLGKPFDGQTKFTSFPTLTLPDLLIWNLSKSYPPFIHTKVLYVTKHQFSSVLKYKNAFIRQPANFIYEYYYAIHNYPFFCLH